MENINKIETELATKLEGLGFYVKHADGWISYVHKETCLDGGIMLDSAECLRQYLRKLNRLSVSVRGQ